ncbi:MAG: tRNA (guanosine(37)-N1)-methyltransferase TrmD [Clostridium sp.]|jgi:tRNA (guanine37-N1)-methyltransferase|nr:tRNA (guanosine(37)-N1)-methyltransferase TrmD [Clostridium sp.]
MRFHILTLFPDMVGQALNAGILGRAAKKGVLTFDVVNIRDHTLDKHGKTDDYPYGGGAGMLLQAQPVFDAWKSAEGAEKSVRTIYVTPQGVPFSQKLAQELSRERELIFLCGHYEGVDERVLEEVVTDFVSIGDYVLTGGELPAMVMIDAVSRLVPGVLHNGFSAQTETFWNDLLEYPQYSRPETWHGKTVPPVLRSGDHRKIAQWRLDRARERTARFRPDLLEKYRQKQEIIRVLSSRKREYIHMIAALGQGLGEPLYFGGGELLIHLPQSRLCMLAAVPEAAGGLPALQGEGCFDRIPQDTKWLIVQGEARLRQAEDLLGMEVSGGFRQAYASRKEALPVRHKDIRFLEGKWEGEKLRAETLYGAFVEGTLAGCAALYEDGSLGTLSLQEEYRGTGIEEALMAYAINRAKERGWIPFCRIFQGEEASLELVRKLGLNLSRDTIWWMKRR